MAIGVVIAASLLPVEPTQQSAIADPAFVAYFQRTSEQGQALLWGNGPIASLVEPFTGAPGNRRLVEYFERGRMELASEDGEDEVTTGLLVREMATGDVQVGYDSFVRSDPAQVALFHPSTGSIESVTYADFSEDVRSRAADRTESSGTVIAWLLPGGDIEERTTPERVSLTRYDDATGHNVPGIFDSWLATAPLDGMTPLEALGHPISEAYWVESGKGSGGVSLVQLFERHVVVYTPGLPEGERFSLARSGRHYYQWRYASAPAAAAKRESISEILPVGEPVDLSVPQGYSASRLSVNAEDVIDIAEGPDGRLALLRASGSVDLYDPRQAGDAALQPFVEQLVNPVAITWSGTSLYVVDDSGVTRYEDSNADGQVDRSSVLVSEAMQRSSVALTAGSDAGVTVAGRAASTATPETEVDGRDLQTVAERGGVTWVARLSSSSGPVLVDPSGAIWTVNAQGSLVRINAETGAEQERMDLATLGADASVVRLLLYRSDGLAGDPATDLLAVVRDGSSGGRLVRLMPTLNDAATPTTGPPAGAVVEFASGFDRPAAVTVGLDGSLYVLDSGRHAIYLIRPST
ncbi:MAG: hypothetical protein M9890_12115 [Thermomicrobiales bacterium]|nr:hypothetical protein [Thermomicrobiales bacterium]